MTDIGVGSDFDGVMPLEGLVESFRPNVMNDHYDFLKMFHPKVFVYLLRFLSLSDNKVFGVWGGNSVWEKCSVIGSKLRIDFE